jgi:hypothetical protein
MTIGTVEEQLVDLILDDTSIAAAIGDRVFPVALYKKTTFPAITYQRVRSQTEFVLGGGVAWYNVLVGLAVWAENYPDARTLAEDLRGLLNGYNTETAGAIQIATVEDGPDAWIEALNVFGCTLQVTVQWGG